LDVFCVSNKLYEKHSRKGNTGLVLASGIPDVRRFCHSIMAEAQLREATHFLQSSLFGLVNSLEMWATSASAVQEGDTGEVEASKNKIALAIKKTVGSLNYQWLPND
jgi:hypothetical protein